MQLVSSVTIFITCSIGMACARVNLGYVAIFSNAEIFRFLYSFYVSCIPSPKVASQGELISPIWARVLAGKLQLMD